VLLDAKSGETHPLLATSANERGGSVSPDGHWLAYSSDESGRSEIYLRSFADLEHRMRISSAGGARACWSHDGQELFFVADDRLVRVAINTQPTLEVSKPELVFPNSVSPNARLECDVTPDGKSFVTVTDCSRMRSSRPSLLAIQPTPPFRFVRQELSDTQRANAAKLGQRVV
jgi:Tol biopolymer transport system component